MKSSKDFFRKKFLNQFIEELKKTWSISRIISEGNSGETSEEIHRGFLTGAQRETSEDIHGACYE